MQPTQNATVFIVDDDSSVREALAWLLRSRHLLSESYGGGDEFEAMLAAGYTPAQPASWRAFGRSKIERPQI